jgi:hypothetical protein
LTCTSLLFHNVGMSPKKQISAAEPPIDSEFSAIMSRKKLNHGRFEDPYKSKVLCWVIHGRFFVLSLGPDRSAHGSPPEEINISSCQVL